MAVRRLNYTGRKRLIQSDLRISILPPENGVASFDATLTIDRYKLPTEAEVVVEAYRQTSWMRFRFGTVGHLAPRDDLKLTEFDSPEGILFRVRVTSLSDSRGLILAEADRIRPREGNQEAEGNRIPLLPVKPDDNMGEEIWRVDFEDRPILLINAAVGDWRSLAKEPIFVSLVYPAVLREILSRILWIEKYFETEDAEDWKSQWLRFATLLPGISDPPTEENNDKFDDWINESVKAFCRRFRIMDRFRTWWTGEAES